MNKQNHAKRFDLETDPTGSASGLENSSYSQEDRQFLEHVRQKVRTDFSSESKIRESLRKRFMQPASGETGQVSKPKDRSRVNLRPVRQISWAGMSIILVFLFGLTIVNLDSHASLATPNLAPSVPVHSVMAPASIQNTFSSTLMPSSTLAATKPMVLQTEFRATPGAPSLTMNAQLTISPLPAASPASFPGQ